MKYLKCFESFLITESELKHSESLKIEIEKFYKTSVDNFEKLKLSKKENPGKFRDDGIFYKIKRLLGFENQDEYWKNFYQERPNNEKIQAKASDIIYPKIKQQLGAVILKVSGENNFSFDSKFISEFDLSLKSGKLTPVFQKYLDEASIDLYVNAFYDIGEKVSDEDDKRLVNFGNLGNYDSESFINSLKSDKKCGSWALELNLNQKCREVVSQTIRHELQHLTQYFSSLCISLSEQFQKESVKNTENVDLSDLITQIYENNIKKIKVGVSKTISDISQNKKDNEDEKLKSAYKKVYNDDLDLDVKDELEKAKSLKYLLDDVEYKPWITDLVNMYMKKLSKDSFQILKNTDTEYRKKLGDEYSLEDLANSITKYILEEDKVVFIFKKYRKETGSDILKLVTNALEKLNIVPKNTKKY
jgi:hypothetical protein